MAVLHQLAEGSLFCETKTQVQVQEKRGKTGLKKHGNSSFTVQKQNCFNAFLFNFLCINNENYQLQLHNINSDGEYF